MGFFLFVEHGFEFSDLLLHLSVDLQVPPNDLLHFIHVIIDVATLIVILTTVVLQTTDQLTFLSQQLSRLLQVLQVLRAQNILLIDDIVDLLVESQ